MELVLLLLILIGFPFVFGMYCGMKLQQRAIKKAFEGVKR